jgi:hypothetical protein
MARKRSRKTDHPRLPALKLFRSISWSENASVGQYVSHLLQELGRLGLGVHDIERRDRPPHTKTVLSDLIDWLDEHPGKSFANLVNWQALDLAFGPAPIQWTVFG